MWSALLKCVENLFTGFLIALHASYDLNSTSVTVPGSSGSLTINSNVDHPNIAAVVGNPKRPRDSPSPIQVDTGHDVSSFGIQSGNSADSSHGESNSNNMYGQGQPQAQGQGAKGEGQAHGAGQAQGQGEGYGPVVGPMSPPSSNPNPSLVDHAMPGDTQLTNDASNRTLVDLSSVLASLQALLNQQLMSGSPQSGRLTDSSGVQAGFNTLAPAPDGSSNQGSVSSAASDNSHSVSDSSANQVYVAGYAGVGQPNGMTGIDGTYTVNGRFPRSTTTPMPSSGSDQMRFSRENIHSSGTVNSENTMTNVANGAISESVSDSGSGTSSDNSGPHASYTGGTPRLTINRQNSTGMDRSGASVQERTLQGGCGMPNSVGGFPVEVSKIMGGWFEYMYRTPGFDQVYNVFNTYTPLGYVMLRNSGNWALATTFNVNMYIKMPSSSGNLQCTGMFEQANFTSDGRKLALAFLPGSQSASRFVYTVLFTDYKTMELAYRCNQPNLATGICDTPYLWVNTRMDPRNLSQAAQKFIQSTVDMTLAPYCFGAKDLSVTQWVTAPPCMASSLAPNIFTNFVQNLQSSLSFKPSSK